MWCVPKLDEEYVDRMEDVLNLYSEPLKKNEPLVCIDERPVQLLDDVRERTAAAPGRKAHIDYEYKRLGTANIFAIVAPKLGRHFTYASANRKAPEYVAALQRIARAFPKARKIQLVQDNLSTHSENSCVKVLGLREGRKLWRRFKVHYTPKHGSWLNKAETEISLWGRECLGARRIPSLDKLASETAAWNTRAHKLRRKIIWRFNVEAARRKFKIRVVNQKSQD